jgi:pimeloyl-ACP methyl ester carboxylesterase
MVLRSARGDPRRFAQGMARRLPEADRLTTQRMLARPGAQQALIADLRESYRQGTAVLAADLLQYSRPWGFSLGEVTTTVHLWHGEQDPKVPITVARQMTVMLPHCQAHFGAGGHMMAYDHAGEILTALTSALSRTLKNTDVWSRRPLGGRVVGRAEREQERERFGLGERPPGG